MLFRVIVLGHAVLSAITSEGWRGLVLTFLAYLAFIPWCIQGRWNAVSVVVTLGQLAIIWFGLRGIVRYFRRRDTPGRFIIYCASYVVLCLGTNLLILLAAVYFQRFGFFHTRI